MPNLERDLLRDCKQILTIYKRGAYLDFWRIPGGAKIYTIRKRTVFLKNNDTAGFSDIFVILKGGKSLFIELKTANGKMSDDQKLFRARVIDIGAAYALVRSMDDLFECLKSHGIPDLRSIARE